jgi:hypothetical protein
MQRVPAPQKCHILRRYSGIMAKKELSFMKVQPRK